MSQSYRTDLVLPEYVFPSQDGNPNRRKPTVLIWSVPTLNYENLVWRNSEKSQSHCADLVSSVILLRRQEGRASGPIF